MFFADGQDLPGDTYAVFVSSIALGFDASLSTCQVFACKCSAGQRSPGCYRHPKMSGHRDQVPFGATLDQAILYLQGDKLAPAHEFSEGVAFADDPGGGVTDGGIVDLALADEVVECREDFVDRRVRVERVELEEIDVVRAEPA